MSSSSLSTPARSQRLRPCSSSILKLALRLYRFGILGCVALGYIVYLFIKGINKKSPKFIAFLPLMWLLLESLCENTFKCYNITYFMFAGMILFQYATSNKAKEAEDNKQDNES